MRITFHGAAGTVTGSKTLIEAGGQRILIDCGLFQGFKQLRLRNWASSGLDPQHIDAVVLTHAHLDHSGLLPRLVRDGYSGPVYCTQATASLLHLLLLDAAHLQEEDARYANHRGYSKHRPALPLYTTDGAERALALVSPVDVDAETAIGDVVLTLLPAGHILGAASARLTHRGRAVLFSGDIGRQHDLLMRPPRPFGGADLLVVESTYGDRLHGDEDAASALANVVNRVCGRGGTLLVPAFAVGRSQALLHLIAMLKADGRIPDVPVSLNSPMAIDATKIFCAHPDDHRLAPDQCHSMCNAATYTRTVEQSKALNRDRDPKILIAGSGMATGGRILHHLAAFAPDARNGILLVGFQAAGTRGAQIAAGAESVKIHGEYVPVRAERFRMDGLSGHADYQEILTWLGGARQPGQVVINHGEPGASDALRLHLRETLGWEAVVAEDRGVFEVATP